MSVPDVTRPARWIRTLPWLAGLLVGASAHVVWWSRAMHEPAPASIEVHLDEAAHHAPVHVHMHAPSHARPTNATPAVACAGSSSRPAVIPSGVRGAVVCSGDACTIRRSFIGRMLDDPRMLSDLRWQIVHGDDRQVTLRVRGVYPGSVAEVLGLRNGDEIVAINGHPLRPEQTPIRLGRVLYLQDGFTLDLRRHDTIHTRRFTIIDDPTPR